MKGAARQSTRKMFLIEKCFITLVLESGYLDLIWYIHWSISSSTVVLILYMMNCPCLSEVTNPACLNRSKWCEIVGLPMLKWSAMSPALISLSLSRSKISLRIGSFSALKSAFNILVFLYFDKYRNILSINQAFLNKFEKK